MIHWLSFLKGIIINQKEKRNRSISVLQQHQKKELKRVKGVHEKYEYN
jgi:hypothetical protein